MELPRLNESVVRVIRLEPNAAGGYKPVVLFERPQVKRGKSSQTLRALERSHLRAIDACKTFLDVYSQRLKESNEQRPDGWVVDMAPNAYKAGKLATKKLRLFRFPLS
jgi:hypothetical protein